LGSPGLIIVLAYASQVFQDMKDSLLEAASKQGDLLWEIGIVKTGNQLGYGVAGNGYAFHSLFRTYAKMAKKI
jgi:hypothetical protein